MSGRPNTTWSATLRGSGHEVHAARRQATSCAPIRDAVESFKPHVVFNLLEEFHGEAVYDHSVVSYLELLRVPYTGCNPRGLVLARGKDLAKKLVHYHRVPTPAFAVFPMGRKVKRPPRLALPLIVKSLIEDASMGIAQASVVETDEALAERVDLHPRADRHRGDRRAIYRGPRDLCRRARQRPPPRAADLGAAVRRPGAGQRGRSRPRRSSTTSNTSSATASIEGPAKGLPPPLAARIQSMVKRICRTLELDGYARIDFRLAPDGTPYFIEANPNPEIAKIEEFARSAQHDGLKYPDLLNRILALGLNRAKYGSAEA